jgi:hypothetical protein
VASAPAELPARAAPLSTGVLPTRNVSGAQAGSTEGQRRNERIPSALFRLSGMADALPGRLAEPSIEQDHRFNVMCRIALLLLVHMAFGVSMWGCSTVRDGPHDALLLTGTVIARAEVEAKPETEGPSMQGPAYAVKPGTGGAVGGALAAVIPSMIHNRSPAVPAYTNYTVKADEGQERVVSSVDNFSVGSCVNLYVDANKLKDPYWRLGEVSIRTATTCRPKTES